ncbi:hypothetical protein SmJEL517_g05311 [Synchytrium microbalum]|uniref:Uncharacterized protein n=1 Tax=Synchytrium microbalum TaxID=1806994 RepID=A0A507BWV8_9FUNG|nr:uncharacterized protein SmJEL517_g05311 [Synchytrium microbalum]TPX31359.1 hypothetical protein SmJEL517_g05311 [Synchytrium microbalum]
MRIKTVKVVDSSTAIDGKDDVLRRRRVPSPTPPSPTGQREEPDRFQKALTCGFEHMPHWMQDNGFILSGYRFIDNSYRECVKSMFYLHNETLNVYTHLIGSLAFVVLAYLTIWNRVPWSESMENASWIDIVAWSCFFAGAIGCMGLSAAFHLFQCHSYDVCTAWNKADYVGIVTLIVGSSIPALYYGLICSPTLQTWYIALMTVAGTATIIASAFDVFRSVRFRTARTIVFVALGVTAIFPITHAVFLWGVSEGTK